MDRGDKLCTIVGHDGGGSPGARYSDIEALLIDEVGRAAVCMDDDMICRSPLCGKGSIDIAMSDMPVARGAEIEGP